VQLRPACLPAPQNRLPSCKQAAATAVARAGSNGNGTSSTQQQQISIIASDVDGTLLNSQQQLTPAVEAAVKQAAAAGVPVGCWRMFGLFTITNCYYLTH
jgi:ABC-type sugar transport system substrate-binding protein